MDTFRIYQELVPLLGEAPAKGLTLVLSQIVNDLAQTVSKAEFAELRAVVSELAAAQKRTEERVEELAAAQKRTEEAVRELAEALKETRTMVGGLSDAVGYSLEDRAIQALPGLLPELTGIEAQGAFERRWVTNSRGQLIELNLLGYGRRPSGEEVTLVGEAKARARVRDVDQLLQLLEGLRGTPVVRGELLGVLVSYQVRPELEERAEEAGVLVVPSYRLKV